jgi:hypothetical protein
MAPADHHAVSAAENTPTGTVPAPVRRRSPKCLASHHRAIHVEWLRHERWAAQKQQASRGCELGLICLTLVRFAESIEATSTQPRADAGVVLEEKPTAVRQNIGRECKVAFSDGCHRRRTPPESATR